MGRILHNLSPRTWLTRVRNARTELRDISRDSDQVVSVTTQMVEDLASQRETIHNLRSELAGITQNLTDISQALADQRQRFLLALRMVRDDDARSRRQLLELRQSPAYHEAFEVPEPLVSVVIPTYTNWRLLRDRSIPSVLAQTYKNWECIVVGDAAPEETKEVVDSFGDDRIQFVNLPYRGPYPDDPKEAHMISGTPPWNAGVTLAKGRWIAPHADDDALRSESISILLQHARLHQAEVAYGYINMIHPDQTVDLLGEFPPRWTQWGMQASLIHAGLRFLELLPSDWVFEIPNDMSLMERMLRIGVRFAMAEDTVVDYYPSTFWSVDRLPRQQ